MTREQILLDLQQVYQKRQEQNLRIYESRVAEACAQIPGLNELMTRRHAMVMGAIRAGILSAGRNHEAQQSLPSLMADMNRQIKEKLISGGFPEDYLQPVYTCSICKDEGYIYDPSRRMCSCLNQELNRRLLEEAGLSGDDQTFENHDLDLFSDEEDPKTGISQRQLAKRAKLVCETFADSFPDTKKQNLLLIGNSGLGKTYLLRCIAHRTAQRGFQPTYTSAYHFLELARKGYMENSAAPLASLMEAELLLIDDLGTEPLMQNITVTQLFNLLNERQLKGLHTVISTNLSMTELKERYTERITSRLQDASCWEKMTFIGADIRPRLKRS